MEPGVEYSEMSVVDFAAKFKSEEDCRAYLFKIRWPEGFICPRCGCIEYSWHSTRNLFQCKGCKYQASITAGTIFHKTRTPLLKWFWAIFLITRQKNGISARALMKLLEINRYDTAWFMCHKIRKAMAERDANYRLAGLIEMDDAYFGGRKSGKRGRGAKGKTIVSVCVENNDGKPGFAAMKVVDEATSDEFRKVAEEKIVKEKSVVKSDGFRAYKRFGKVGFTHTPVKACGKEASKVLPWVHTLIGNAKAAILATFHGVSGKHLQRFLDEYIYRFNRRFFENELFDRLLTACARTMTITCAELTG